jgi:hypothetical protein
MENLLLSTVPVKELAALLFQEFKQLQAKEPPSHPPTITLVETYKTRKETSQQLNVSLPTLNEYEKKGLIKGHRFGVRVLYKQSDIEEALTKRNFGCVNDIRNGFINKSKKTNQN